MTQKTSFDIECFCSACFNALQPKAIRCKNIDGTHSFTISLEPCKRCAQKARIKMKKVRERFHRRHPRPIRGLNVGGNFEPNAEVEKFLSDEEKQIEQEKVMNQHAASGKFGDIASGDQPFQD